jgi:wyosine [tRNA(Phe)-imidazoG37] synthetase (radical SAM superfamily)
MIAFRPVPSRRLGRSLEINNIPPKVCTYSCVYCEKENLLSITTVHPMCEEAVSEFLARAGANWEVVDISSR